jgi:curved DNA-binding protein CbpA
MKKTYSYKDCYRILGAKPDSEWSELRKTYKKSIQKWHPDRYEEGSDEKSAADNKIKSINIAYNQISTYYRNNGSLPPDESQATTRPTSAKAPLKEQTQAKSNKQKKQKSTATHTSRQNLRKTSKHPLRSSVLLVVIAATTYYIFTDDLNMNFSILDIFSDTQENLQYKPEINSKSKNIGRDTKRTFYQPVNNRYFTIGSSISDVINIQGTPTRTEGDIWYYGESEVHFSEGEVIRWVRNIETPLRANLDIKQKFH